MVDFCPSCKKPTVLEFSSEDEERGITYVMCKQCYGMTTIEDSNRMATDFYANGFHHASGHTTNPAYPGVIVR